MVTALLVEGVVVAEIDEIEEVVNEIEEVMAEAAEAEDVATREPLQAPSTTLLH